MIINRYDTLPIKLNRSRPFINISTKKLVLPFNGNKQYYNVARRYDSKLKLYNYFVILTDEFTNNALKVYKMHNKVYLKLDSIWNSFNIDTSKHFNVNVKFIESDGITDVYQIEY